MTAVPDAPPAQRKREKRNVDGWLILDKPVGMTSTHAVSVVKRAFAAKKAGHAGTLDPLATGVLPIALGEATKTVPFVMDGRKSYRFTVRWGIETDTDDAEGQAIASSEGRPDMDAVRAALPRFTGTIMQTPPKFSAVKIAGERAYDLAREGEAVSLEPRPVEIDRFDLVRVVDGDHAEFAAECGKGTYVRALARDLGRALGTCGHVVALRRTAVGPFTEQGAASLAELQQVGEAGARGQPRRCRTPRARPGGAAPRTRCPDPGRVGRGVGPGRPDRARGGRTGRIAAAPHIQSVTLTANSPWLRGE